MARFLAILRLVFSRSMGNRRLLATVMVGVVLSAALMSSVAIYSDAIRDLGLKFALEGENPRDLDIEILSSSQGFTGELYDDRVEITGRQLATGVGEILDATVRYGRSDTFFLAPVGVPPDLEDDGRPRSHFQFYEGLDEQIEVVEGRIAEIASPASGAPAVEVMLGAKAAVQLGVAVGDSFDLHPFWALGSEPVKVTVVGLIAPLDPDDPFWFGVADESRFIVTNTSWPTYAFFVPEETLTGALTTYLPDLRGSFWTYGLVDADKVNSRNAGGIVDSVKGMSAGLKAEILRTTVNTELPNTIESYEEKLFFTRLPLFALMVQIVGIVLYYLVMVSNMLVERQVGEIALFKSRGASTGQVMLIYFIEGAMLCLVGVVVGPLLAGTAISLLGLTPSFSGLSGGSTIAVNYSIWAILLAVVGVLLALAALLIPAYRATSNSIVNYKQSLARPPQQPAFLRYYLDLGLIVVGAFFFYQLRQQGSLVTDRLFGDLSADPLLLVTPTLFMLMIALVFLRLFPLVLRVASWAGRGLNGATIPLGLVHLVRSPLHYSRLILLLLLATAVGMFAAGFRATLEQSYDDRSAYEAGAPARLTYTRGGSPPDQFVSQVEETTNSEGVTPVARMSASYSDLATFTFVSSDLLAVRPGEFEQIAYWRNDFAGASLEELMGRLVPEEEEPAPEVGKIPAGNRYIGLWAKPPDLLTNPAFHGRMAVRVSDENKSLWEFTLFPVGEPDTGGWQFYAGALDDPESPRNQGSPDPAQELQLDAIFFRFTQAPTGDTRHVFLADALQTGTALPAEDEFGFADPTIVDEFEDVAGYATIGGVSQLRQPAVLSRVEEGRSDRYAAKLEFSVTDQGPQLFGFRPRSGADAMAVIVSEGFLEETGLERGDATLLYINRQYVNVVLAGSFSYFPTWDPNGREELVVANLDTIQDLAARVPVLATGAYPNEAWLPSADGMDLDPEALVLPGSSFAPEVTTEAGLREEAGSDPLVAASWEGILFLSFASVLLLTALGFVVYSFLTAQSRSLEFAILRTMGFSTRQIFGLVSFEQIFVIVSGALVGTFLGMPLSGLMIDFMGVNERGEDVIPPIVTQVSWSTVLTVYSLLAVVFVATIVALAILYSRLSVHRALRMGEL